MSKETPELSRQKKLATAIGVEFCNTPNLKPLMAHGQFYTPPLPANDTWIGQLSTDTIAIVAFAAVAAKLKTITPHWHIIDHAWLAGYNTKPCEPWALIAEPYADEDDARKIRLLSDDAMPDWGIEIHILPASRSSWNPGHCLPIVATIGSRGYANFFRCAIPWALGSEESERAMFS